ELNQTLTSQVHAVHAARKICDWSTAERLERIVVEKLRSGPAPTDYPQPFPILNLATATPREILAAGAQVASHYRSLPAQPHRPAVELDAGKKLRIGYLTPDMHNHPMAHLSTELFELHDRARFEIILFDYAPPKGENAYRKRALAAFDKVIDIR